MIFLLRRRVCVIHFLDAFTKFDAIKCDDNAHIFLVIFSRLRFVSIFLSFRMKFNVIVFVVLVNALNNGGFAQTSLVKDLPPPKEEIHIPKTCTYDRVYKMNACDCSKMDLKEVPTHLRSNIEVSVAIFSSKKEENIHWTASDVHNNWLERCVAQNSRYFLFLNRV